MSLEQEVVLAAIRRHIIGIEMVNEGMFQKRDCHVHLYYEVRVTQKEKDYIIGLT